MGDGAMRGDNVTITQGADDAEIAHWLHGQLSCALAAQEGPVVITMPGGSTPFPILEQLRKMPLDWSRLVVWPGDDRVVPEGHPASNVGRIRAVLEPSGVKLVPLEVTDKPPHFSLAWLGMGADGHVASLFPSSDPQVDDALAIRRITPDPLPPEAPFDRLSLTIPSLLNSDQLLFVIRGEEKRILFETALRGEHDLPVARLLCGGGQPVTCFT